MDIQIIGNGDIRSNSFNTVFLINNILVGAPGGTLKMLKQKQINIDDISLIIITHLHGEEYFDLPQIIYHEYQRGRTKSLVIIGPANLKRQVNKLLKMANYQINPSKQNFTLDFIAADTIQNANLALDLYFSFINVRHANLKECYALIIKNQALALGYTGGASLCPGLSYLLKEVKTCLIPLSNDELDLTLAEFTELASAYPITYLPLSYPAEIKDELKQIKNVKILEAGEQFFI